MGKDLGHRVRSILSLAVAVGLLGIGGCASDLPQTLEEWSSEDVIDYRIVSKDDFWSRTSNSTWGNVAHGAEICTTILPTDERGLSGSFRAVMKRECSFWNKAIGPLGFLGRLVSLATGVPMVVPVKQPEWYILQHEQVHFAIMHVAALQLSRQLGRLHPSQRTPRMIDRAYEITLQNTSARHDAFDGETSGRFDPTQLEKWVRVLERQLEELCSGATCVVRTTARQAAAGATP